MVIKSVSILYKILLDFKERTHCRKREANEDLRRISIFISAEQKQMPCQ